jgi:hypothetical protein
MNSDLFALGPLDFFSFDVNALDDLSRLSLTDVPIANDVADESDVLPVCEWKDACVQVVPAIAQLDVKSTSEEEGERSEQQCECWSMRQKVSSCGDEYRSSDNPPGVWPPCVCASENAQTVDDGNPQHRLPSGLERKGSRS